MSQRPSTPPAFSPTHAYACTTCVQRKVKCDKRQPCLACTKSHLQCRYRSTPPPQRRKRKLVELGRTAANQALLEKLRAYEDVLRHAGLPFEPFDEGIIAVPSAPSEAEGDQGDRDGDGDGAGAGDGAGESGSRSQNPAQGQALPNPIPTANLTAKPNTTATFQMSLFPRKQGILIPEYGGRRYYEHAMIGQLGQKHKLDLPDPQRPPGWQQQELLLQSLLTSFPSFQDATKGQYPPATAVLKYWSIYKENIHPLTMVIHAPTVEHIMTGRANETLFAPNSPKKSIDALLFSIYACAVSSLKDKECRQIFGESQQTLLQTMQSAAQYALMESSFLRVPDLDLLRALVLLLTSMLHTTNSPSLWVMLGTVMRIAQAHGLHRDGVSLGLPPFEVELRRRLWWYVVSLDARVTEIMGCESTLPRSADTSLPSNINDRDLEPGMPTPATERPGASDMMFCLVKYETVRFLLQCDPRVNSDADSQPLLPSNKADAPVKAGLHRSKSFTVSDLESYLEDKALRFCDPVTPLHLLTTAIARSSICRLRQMAHRGRSRATNQRHFNPDAEYTNNKRILITATRTISYDNLIHSSPSLSGFLWHVDYYFSWGSAIFILNFLASARNPAQWDEDMHAAWTNIEKMLVHHPEFSSSETDKPEHLIIAELTLKAWNAREAAFVSEGTTPQMQQIPAVIAQLQARHTGLTPSQPFSNNSPSNNIPGGIMVSDADAANFSDLVELSYASFATGLDMMDLPFIGVDWNNWEELHQRRE